MSGPHQDPVRTRRGNIQSLPPQKDAVSEDPLTSRREQRAAAAAEHAAAQERRRAAETAQARRLVTEFVREARGRGLPLVPLMARPYSGRGTYKTGLRGWYIRRDRSLAVGEDGSFYVLSVPASLLARVRGVDVPPADPPLIAGVGGRDGESMPLEELLRRRLDAPEERN